MIRLPGTGTGTEPLSAPLARLPRTVLLTLCACVMVAQSMVAAINLLLPQLAASRLHPSDGQLLWAVDAYVIAFAGLLIPAGAVGDRFGRKGALLSGLGLFAVGALLSASAGSVAALIAGRAVCGAGAALITPGTMSVLVQLTTPARRPAALAAWTLALGLGGLFGNLGGGLVGQFASWRVLFWVMAPLAAVLAAAVAVFVPRTARHGNAAVDPLGSLLLTAALVAVVLGIIEGPDHGWGSVLVLGAFGAGAVLLTLFTWHALRAERPLFDPRVFRSPRLRAGALGIAVGFFGLFALFYVNSQYLQYAKGFDPAVTGVAIVPLVVGMAVLPRFGARWQAASGPLAPIGTGLLLIAAGLALVSTAGVGTPYPLYALYLLVVSAGAGLSAPPLTIAVVTELPPHQAGLGSGLNAAAREIGASLGVATVGTVLASKVPGGAAAGAAHPAAFVSGMDTGLRVVAGLALLATVAVMMGLRHRSAAAAAPAAAPATPEPQNDGDPAPVVAATAPGTEPAA